MRIFEFIRSIIKVFMLKDRKMIAVYLVKHLEYWKI